MNQKKVIIIGSAHPLRGGLANFNERLAREFINAGFQTTIYTFSLQYPSLLFPGKTQYSADPQPEGLNIRVAINSINPFNWLKWGKKIRSTTPDMVIIKFWIPFMAPCLGSLARIIRANRKTKVITILDNLVPHEKRLFDKPLAAWFIRSVDGIVAMSRAVLQQVNDFDETVPRMFSPHPVYDNYGEKIPRDLARKKLGLHLQDKYILFFGFIRDYKGLDLLLQAMADKSLQDAGIKLIVAGEFYTDPKPYLKYIADNNLGDRIIMHTVFIPDSEVSLYFSAADLVVQPYKHATQSGVTQIAYHFEVAMITTDVGGLAEIVPDGKVGYVVRPEPTAIANGIRRFFNNMPGDFLQHIQEEKKKYLWSYMVNNILELSNSVPGNKTYT